MVKVNRVLMIDAADFGGTGEMFFSSQIGHPGSNFWEPGNSLAHAGHPSNGQTMEVSSATFVSANFKMFGYGVGDAIELAFSVIEEDAGSVWPGSLDTHGTAGFERDKYFGTYDSGDYEANGGIWSFNIDGGTLLNPGEKMSN